MMNRGGVGNSDGFVTLPRWSRRIGDEHFPIALSRSSLSGGGVKRVLRSCPMPRKIVTDQLRSYPAAKSRIPELAHVKHVFVKAAARVNNRAENSHPPTRERERRFRRVRDPKRTQTFLSNFGPIRQHLWPTSTLFRTSSLNDQVVRQLRAYGVLQRHSPQYQQNSAPPSWPTEAGRPLSGMVACREWEGKRRRALNRRGPSTMQ
jgi:hypothetical protein